MTTIEPKAHTKKETKMRKPKYDNEIIKTLSKRGPMTAAEVREELDLPQNGIIYQILKRMVSRGLIHKKLDKYYSKEKQPMREVFVDVDELSGIDPKESSEFVYDLIQGQASFFLWQEIGQIDEKIENLMITKLYLVQRAQQLGKGREDEFSSGSEG